MGQLYKYVTGPKEAAIEWTGFFPYTRMSSECFKLALEMRPTELILLDLRSTK